jgi:predicted alpha/beta hydrolase family esterase
MSTFVLFIGGYGSKISDIEHWKTSAAGQRKDLTFDGFPWPPSAKDSSDTSAVSAFEAAKSMPEAIKKITDSSSNDVYIVGHSSGCAIANKIDEELAKALGKSSKVTVNLVTLDGFKPSDAQRGRPTTQLWCAEDSKNKSNKSKNYKFMKHLAGLKLYQAQDCTNIWSLHFSLVNSAVNDKTVGGYKDLPSGYLNCRANLCWAPAPAPAPAKPSPASPATPAKTPN